MQDIYVNPHGYNIDIPYTLTTWTNYKVQHDGIIQICAYNGGWVSLANTYTNEKYASRLDNTNQYNPCILSIHAKKGDNINFYIDGTVLDFKEFYK